MGFVIILPFFFPVDNSKILTRGTTANGVPAREEKLEITTEEQQGKL